MSTIYDGTQPAVQADSYMHVTALRTDVLDVSISSSTRLDWLCAVADSTHPGQPR